MPGARRQSPRRKRSLSTTQKASAKRARRDGRPRSQPASPVKQPGKPVSQPTTPVKQPAKPVSLPATPVKQPAATPQKQPGKPVSLPATPVKQPVKPLSPAATPQKQPPSEEETAPSDTQAAAATETTNSTESSQQVGETSAVPTTEQPLPLADTPQPTSPQLAVEAVSVASGIEAQNADIQSATPNATSSPTRDEPSSHADTPKSTRSTPKFTPSKSSTVGSRKIKADLLLARKDDLQELLISETIPHTNTESSTDTDGQPTDISLDASAQDADADAENTDSTVPMDLSVDRGESLVGKEPPNIPVDLTKKTAPNKVVTTEADGEAYLNLTVPSIELGGGVVIGSVTPNSNLGEFKTKELRSEAKRIRRELDKTSERFRDAHNECTRLRDLYYYNALKHAEISHHIHIREALKVTGKLNRPLTENEKLLVDSMSLRSGKKLKLKKQETEDEMQDRIFNFDATAMMKDFKRNIKHVKDDKAHSKARVCLMQTFTERCAVCSKTFRTADGLHSHLVAHTKMFYRCPLCIERNGSDRPFTSLKAFKHHLKWHSLSEPLYVCPECGVEKEWQKNLDSHMTTHRPADLPCREHDNCEALFSFENERKHHERFGEAKQIFKCDQCSSMFKSYIKKELHDARYHTIGGKHYKGPGTASTQTSASAADTKAKKKELKAKNKAKILAPLLADLSTTTESGINTNMDTSTSEYNPSARELAEADASDSSDFLPDVA